MYTEYVCCFKYRDNSAASRFQHHRAYQNQGLHRQRGWAPKVYRDIAYQLPLHIEDLNWLRQSLHNQPSNPNGILSTIKGYNAKLVALDSLLAALIPSATASWCRDCVAIGFELVEYLTQAHNICVITSQKGDSIFKEGLLLKECNMYITDTEA